MIETDATRLQLLSDFGINATLTGGVTVLGVWDDAFLMASLETMQIAASEPQFFCRSSDVASVVAGDTVVINSTTYYVNSAQPDGTGFTTLSLHT